MHVHNILNDIWKANFQKKMAKTELQACMNTRLNTCYASTMITKERFHGKNSLIDEKKYIAPSLAR